VTKPPEAARGTVSVLSVSPNAEDHVSLARIFDRAEWTGSQNLKFEMKTSSALPSALAVLQEHRTQIVVCERDLAPDTWRDLLDLSAGLPVPPLVIVASRLADERLWAEALNLGAYDVLVKPFHAAEVCRVMEGAWHRWKAQQNGFHRTRSR